MEHENGYEAYSFKKTYWIISHEEGENMIDGPLAAAR